MPIQTQPYTGVPPKSKKRGFGVDLFSKIDMIFRLGGLLV